MRASITPVAAAGARSLAPLIMNMKTSREAAGGAPASAATNGKPVGSPPPAQVRAQAANESSSLAS